MSQLILAHTVLVYGVDRPVGTLRYYIAVATHTFAHLPFSPHSSFVVVRPASFMSVLAYTHFTQMRRHTSIPFHFPLICYALFSAATYELQDLIRRVINIVYKNNYLGWGGMSVRGVSKRLPHKGSNTEGAFRKYTSIKYVRNMR